MRAEHFSRRIRTRKIFFSILVLSLIFISLGASSSSYPDASPTAGETAAVNGGEDSLDRTRYLSPEESFFATANHWYEEIGYEGMNREMFLKGVIGFFNLLRKGEITKRSLLTLIDYSRSSAEKRFFVIDFLSRDLLFQTFVAHGVNSGVEMATEFSNKANSRQTSLGFFSTAKTYFGKHGYSLKLRGLDPGLNDKAEDRFIVIHGAWYVSLDFILKRGRLGRSWGCPALPVEASKEIIKAIQDGSCLFAFHDEDPQLSKSENLDIGLAVEEFVENWQTTDRLPVAD